MIAKIGTLAAAALLASFATAHAADWYTGERVPGIVAPKPHVAIDTAATADTNGSAFGTVIGTIAPFAHLQNGAGLRRQLRKTACACLNGCDRRNGRQAQGDRGKQHDAHRACGCRDARQWHGRRFQPSLESLVGTKQPVVAEGDKPKKGRRATEADANAGRRAVGLSAHWGGLCGGSGNDRLDIARSELAAAGLSGAQLALM
jgi:hypothetical protein